MNKLARNETLLASAYSAGVVLTQVMNVAQVGVVGPTLFGMTSHGIWISTIELQLMVLLQTLLGSFAALGIIATSFAFSLAVKTPSFIGPTIWSKVVSLLATAVIFWLADRYKWSKLTAINIAWFVALEIDVFAFALLAGLPEIINTSLIIRAVLHATTMAIVYGVARLYRRNGNYVHSS